MDIQLEKKKGIRPKHLVYLAILIGLSFVAWKLVFGTASTTTRIEKEKLSISQVKQGKFDDYITINGFVAPITTIYLDAYESGRVTEKLIEEGATVKKGDIILKLENMELYEQILDSENNLALKQNDLRSTKLAFDARQVDGKKELVTSKYNLQKLDRNFKQNEALYKDELISKEAYLISMENYEIAQQQNEIITLQAAQDEQLRNTSLAELDMDLARMRRTLSMVYKRIDHMNVRAPTDGQLGFLDAEIGQSIQKGQRIGQINVLTNYKIEASIDEHYIDRVIRELSASIDRNGKEFELRVRKVYPEVRDGKFKVDLVFISDKPETIRTGQSYNIKLQLGESKDALLISKGAFYQHTGGQWIYVMNAEGDIAEKRPIRIGKQNARYYELLDGLQAGERIITSNYSTLGDAEKILIK